MANPYLTSATGNGVQTDFVMGFTMDSNLSYLDVTCTLNGTKITNFTKIDTVTLRFTAPIPSGALVFERFTPGGRKFVFTPGTRVVAAQVGGEFDRQSADSLEAAQFSWRNYFTAKANAGAYVAIDSLGEHEVLTTVAPTAIFTSWGSPGAIGNVAPNTGNFTNLAASGTFSVTGVTTLGTANITTLNAVGAATFSGTQTQKDDTAQSLGMSPFGYGFRNGAINGDFYLWQRSTSATPSIVNPTNGQYGPDRFRYRQAGTAATITWSRQPHTIGQAVVPGNPKYFTRFVQTVAPGTSNGYAQRIEDVSRYAGKTITISWYSRFDTSRTLTYTITQNFGTGGAPSGNVVVANAVGVAMTTSFAKYSVTIAIPSISGKTLGTTEFTDYLEIDFGFPLTASFTFDMSDFQVEEGNFSTRFERKPIVDGYLAKRYFRAQPIAIRGANSGFYEYQLSADPPMRAVPTRQITTGNTGDIIAPTFSNLSTFTPTPGSLINATQYINGLGWLGARCSLTPSIQANDCYFLDAILAFEAEL